MTSFKMELNGFEVLTQDESMSIEGGKIDWNVIGQAAVVIGSGLIGSAIGTAICPGAGTIIGEKAGVVVGGAVGSLAGYLIWEVIK